MIKDKNKNQGGYAILFTVIIVSAISVITAGLSNAAYKQLLLSSLAKDSQTAFFQADTAADCALYADQVEYIKYLSLAEGVVSIFDIPDGQWSCGGFNLNIESFNSALPGGYELNPPNPNSSEPCFRITVVKEQNVINPNITNVSISAKGYNICDKSNGRTVEREIEIDYEINYVE